MPKIHVQSLLCCFLCCTPVILGSARVAMAQGPPALSDMTRAKKMALHVCIALQQQAERNEQREGRPSGLRRAYGVKAGLNDTEAEALNEVAARMRARVAPLDERAREIIQAARQKHPGGRLEPGSVPPSPPPQLAALQRQRDAAVEQAIQELDQELGPAGLARLHRYLTETVLARGSGHAAVRTPVHKAAFRGEAQRVRAGVSALTAPVRADTLRKEDKQ